MRRSPSPAACHFVSSAGHRRESNSVNEMFACPPSVFEAGAYVKRGLGNSLFALRPVIQKEPREGIHSTRFSGDMERTGRVPLNF